MFIYLSLSHSISLSKCTSLPLRWSYGLAFLAGLPEGGLLHVNSSCSRYLKAAFCFYSLLDVIISMVVITASLKPARSFVFHPVTLFLHLFPNCKSNTSLRNQFSRIPVPSRSFTDTTILSFPPDCCAYKGKHLKSTRFSVQETNQVSELSHTDLSYSVIYLSSSRAPGRVHVVRPLPLRHLPFLRQ